MTTIPVSTEHIEITPGVCGGKPRIAGTRIKVQHVVLWTERMGWSPDEIVATYTHLTLADVHAALAYYFDHRDEVRESLRQDADFAESLMARQPSIIEKIGARSHVTNGLDPVPPRRESPPGAEPRPPAPGD